MEPRRDHPALRMDLHLRCQCGRDMRSTDYTLVVRDQAAEIRIQALMSLQLPFSRLVITD
jgi:hypothetical protein